MFLETFWALWLVAPLVREMTIINFEILVRFPTNSTLMLSCLKQPDC